MTRSRLFLPAGLSLAALSMATSHEALGQAIFVPPDADISRLRVQPPELPAREDYDLTVRNPEKSAVPKDVESIDFFVSRVRVNGVSHYPEDQVRAIFAPLEGRRVRLEELREGADRLQALYAGEGFLLTRVIVPPQQIDDGVVTVEVIEGFIAEGFFDGEHAATRNLSQQALANLIGQRPLSIRKLDGRLLILNDTPGIVVKSTLRPGTDPGAADIVVTSGSLPNQGYLSVANNGSTTLGPALYSLGYTFNSPLRRPGALDLSLSSAGKRLDELRAISLRYGMPVGSRGVVLYLGGLAAKSKPGGEVTPLDVSSQSYSLDMRLRVPLRRNRATALYLESALLLANTSVRALGTRITHDRIASAQIGLRIRHQYPRFGETTAQVFLSRGISAFGALDASAAKPSVLGFDPKFTKINWQVEHVMPLAPRASLVSRAVGQWTGDRLLAGEQIAFGGPFLGRGYVPSATTGDRGYGFLGELRLDLPQAEVPGKFGGLQVYAFADWAHSWVLPAPDVAKVEQRIGSYGSGLRARLADRFFIDAQVAFAGRRIAGAENRPSRLNISVLSIF